VEISKFVLEGMTMFKVSRNIGDLHVDHVLIEYGEPLAPSYIVSLCRMFDFSVADFGVDIHDL